MPYEPLAPKHAFIPGRPMPEPSTQSRRETLTQADLDRAYAGGYRAGFDEGSHQTQASGSW